jgi:hypothetical protein
MFRITNIKKELEYMKVWKAKGNLSEFDRSCINYFEEKFLEFLDPTEIKYQVYKDNLEKLLIDVKKVGKLYGEADNCNPKDFLVLIYTFGTKFRTSF